MQRFRSVHVVPDRLGRWQVQRDGDDQPLSEHDTATEAERAAAKQPVTEIVIHDRYCRIRRQPVPQPRRP